MISRHSRFSESRDISTSSHFSNKVSQYCVSAASLYAMQIFAKKSFLDCAETASVIFAPILVALRNICFEITYSFSCWRCLYSLIISRAKSVLFVIRILSFIFMLFDLCFVLLWSCWARSGSTPPTQFLGYSSSLPILLLYKILHSRLLRFILRFWNQ